MHLINKITSVAAHKQVTGHQFNHISFIVPICLFKFKVRSLAHSLDRSIQTISIPISDGWNHPWWWWWPSLVYCISPTVKITPKNVLQLQFCDLKSINQFFENLNVQTFHIWMCSEFIDGTNTFESFIHLKIFIKLKLKRNPNELKRNMTLNRTWPILQLMDARSYRSSSICSMQSDVRIPNRQENYRFSFSIPSARSLALNLASIVYIIATQMKWIVCFGWVWSRFLLRSPRCFCSK